MGIEIPGEVTDTKVEDTSKAAEAAASAAAKAHPELRVEPFGGANTGVGGVIRD